MRKIILMTSAAVIAPMSAIAQTPTCTATPDCASLGYTQSSCPDNNGVRCPWGDKWFCTKTCSEMGFNYTCNGENMTGGVGSACNGKYTECTCVKRYVWKDGICEKNSATWGQCSGYAENCALGNILFSDGTCSANTVSGKMPIAVVVYKSDDGKCGQAMALNSVGYKYEWGDFDTNIPDLTDYSSASIASKEVESCENSAIIRAHGDSSAHPAVWAAYNYTTTGTKAGDWCLPAAGIFTSYYNNQRVINTGFSRANGTKFTNSTKAWSSSEHHFNYYGTWFSSFTSSYGLSCGTKNNSFEVRPVIEF